MSGHQLSRYGAISDKAICCGQLGGGATRLAQLDLTELRKIRHTRDVDLIHRTDWWAWWSDQLLTPAIGLPEGLRPQGLSADSEELITDVWASGGMPDCGWATLAAVRQIMRVETLNSLSGEIQCFSHRERLWIQFHDGSQAMLYRYWHWCGEDCLCNCSLQRVRMPIALWRFAFTLD